MKRDSTCMEGEAGPERTERGRLARRLCSGPRCPRSARLCAAGPVRAVGCGLRAARARRGALLCSRCALVLLPLLGYGGPALGAALCPCG